MSSERPSSKIIIQVAGAVIAAAILYLCRSLVPPVGRWLLGIFVAIWRFLGAEYSIPGWLLLVFVACSLLVALRIILSFRQPAAPAASRQLTQDDYVKDSFFDLTWRWRYGQQGIYELVPFCSRCDMQVHPTLDYVDSLQTRTGYHCDNCGNRASVKGSMNTLRTK